mmetsp:Transcript_71216/g.143364  ORF Transcript_71216/g.143364 Transcript_71216/m.143364 type:complete len:99 (+) Transcript_71216:80-376(+)
MYCVWWGGSLWEERVTEAGTSRSRSDSGRAELPLKRRSGDGLTRRAATAAVAVAATSNATMAGVAAGSSDQRSTNSCHLSEGRQRHAKKLTGQRRGKT